MTTRQARLDDFESDVGLAGNQFNVAVSILNVGYMLAQLPSNMILTRVRPSIYLPCCVMVWSCISAATAGVTSFSGLIAVRFFLGIVEAPFFRMFLIVTLSVRVLLMEQIANKQRQQLVSVFSVHKLPAQELLQHHHHPMLFLGF